MQRCESIPAWSYPPREGTAGVRGSAATILDGSLPVGAGSGETATGAAAKGWRRFLPMEIGGGERPPEEERRH